MKKKIKDYLLISEIYNMKKYLIIFLFLFLVSCKEDKKVLQDNATNKLPINPVVEIKKENISKGNQLFLNGNYKEALEYYERGVTENKAIAYYNIGVSYYLLGDLENAEKYFRLAIENDKEFKEAYINLVAVLIAQDKVVEAEKFINIIEKYDDVKTYINLANLYLLKGATAKSYYYFQKAIEKGKENDLVKSSFGSFLISINDIDKGLNYLLEVKNKGYDEYYNLAKGYFYKRDYKKSIDFVKKAIDINKSEEALRLLADNYNAVNDYILEASVLSELIEISNKPEYRFRFALALFKSGDFSKAKEVVTSLINQFPYEGKYYKLKYDILINEQDYNNAREIIKTAYNRIRTSFFKYLYVKHLLLYSNDKKSAYQLIRKSSFSDDYDKLALALYYAKTKSFNKMNDILNQINNKNSEYYLIYSYYLLSNRDFEEALKYIEKMDKFENRYYIYKFVALWNLGNLDELIELSKSRIDNIKYNRQNPSISFTLAPNLYDIGFLYRYDGKFEDVLRLFLPPLIVDPNESVEFLVLGYKLLQDNESLKAINELKKSATFSNGVYYNNKGVESYLNKKYFDALTNFKKAARYLKNNPIVSYNLGLSYLSIGDLKNAFKYFDNSLLNNKFILYSYLGKAIVYYLEGMNDRVSNQYDLAINNYEMAKEKIDYPLIYKFAKLFAEIGLGKYDEVIFEVANSKNITLFEQLIGKLAYYFKENENSFDNEKFLAISNFDCFNDLINNNFQINDNRICKHYKAYAKILLGDIVNIESFSTDKFELAQNIMYLLSTGQYNNALKGM
ncbi:tetratricopeptide repeat protein [Deferribacter thermophilus]|uniref:tetratricopeptide repeat protein n=1 Tax=Deferribacter thermophilus TaxID=53573 RepID=UPI003C289041